jgi:hypothetical protein
MRAFGEPVRPGSGGENATSGPQPGFAFHGMEDKTPAIATMASTSLAQSNKSRTGGKATKKREIRQPTLIR